MEEREQHLDGCWPPVDEVGQLALTDALQALVHIRRVHLTLRSMQTVVTQSGQIGLNTREDGGLPLQS